MRDVKGNISTKSKGLRIQQNNKHASLISFKNQRGDFSNDSKKTNNKSSGKKQQKAVTPVKSSQSGQDVQSNERNDNPLSNKKAN